MPIQLLDRGEIKREARTLLRTARVSPVRFTLLFLAISLLLSLLDAGVTSRTGSIVGYAFVSISFVSILANLLSQVLGAGYRSYCLGVSRGEAMPYESLFDGFTCAGKVIALFLVESIFITLWSMLFFFPGIIAAYRYSFAMWALCEDPSIGVMEALERSKRQTRGYKWQLFALQISFVGWFLLIGAVVGVYESVIVRVLPDSFPGIMLGTLLFTVLSSLVQIYLLPYYSLSVCGFYRRATAPDEPRQDRSGYSPEF